ncbi:hypothetical protein [Sinorhizobium meliloti]|nr:hypothetical protein [Sinorhizobium meliloti]MQV66169.1 hypothetical protein [Sinorhizobium meliloti]
MRSETSSTTASCGNDNPDAESQFWKSSVVHTRLAMVVFNALDAYWVPEY